MKKFVFLLIILCFAVPVNLQAAELSKSELAIGEFFSISGSGFGEQAGEYGKVCFNNGENCFIAGDFTKEGMLWSDAEIKLYAPDNIDISGNVSVYVKTEKRVCQEQTPGDPASATCVNSFVSQSKEILPYKIKPVISSTTPPSPVRPGEKITIRGSGFGGTKGSVYFGGHEGYLISWATTTIEVEPTTIIQDKTDKLKIISSNMLETEIDYVVSTKEEDFVKKPEVPAQETATTTEPSEEAPQEIKKEEVKSEAVIRQEFINQEKASAGQIDQNLANRLKGGILLQVEEQGQAWYVNPADGKKYYFACPADAFNIIRTLALGASHKFITDNKIFPGRVSGKILLDVEDHGKAYYINPKDKKPYYLGRPADAFNVMKSLGLGITNNNIRKIEIGG